MAINPADITTVRVDQLASDAITLTSLLPHQVGTDLKQDTVQALVDLVATAIGAGSGVGYLPISVTDGQQLPDVPSDPSFFLCGAGTYLNINGFPNVVCTGELNAVMSLPDHWELAVEIPIVAEVGVQTVTGSAVDNTDPLNPIINSTGGGGIESVTGTAVDNTDPDNPIIDISTISETSMAGQNLNNNLNFTLYAESSIDVNILTDIDAGNGAIGITYESGSGNFFNGIVKKAVISSYSAGGVKLTHKGIIKSESVFLETGNRNELEFTNPTGVGKTIIKDVVNTTQTIAFVSDIPSPITIDATPTDGSSNAVSSNGVFDGLNKTRRLIVANSASTVTGTTAETIISSLLIPANSFDSLCDIWTTFTYGKSTATAIPIKLYYNTTNSLSGATQLALYNTGSNRNGMLNRIYLLNGTGLDLLASASATSLYNSELIDALFTASTVITIAPTSNIYFIYTVQNDAVGTTFNHKRSTVEKLKLN